MKSCFQNGHPRYKVIVRPQCEFKNCGISLLIYLSNNVLILEFASNSAKSEFGKKINLAHCRGNQILSLGVPLVPPANKLAVHTWQVRALGV